MPYFLLLFLLAILGPTRSNTSKFNMPMFHTLSIMTPLHPPFHWRVLLIRIGQAT